MDNQIVTEAIQDKKEVSVIEILAFIKKNLVVSLAAAVIFAVVAYLAASSIADTTYTYGCSFTVDTFWNNENTETLSPSGAYSAANYAVYSINTHKKYLKGTKLLEDVIKDAGYENQISPEYLRSLIYISNEEDTLIINVTLSNSNKKAIEKLAKSYAKLAPKHSRLSYSSLLLFEATRHVGTSSTPVTLYTGLAFVAGAAIVLFLLYIIESLDTRIKSAGEVEKQYNISNLGVIPNFYVGGGKDYKAYKKGALRRNEAYYNKYYDKYYDKYN